MIKTDHQEQLLEQQCEWAIPSLAYIAGMKVQHGSPGYTNTEVIKDVTFPSYNRVEIEFESGCFTNMSERQFDEFCESGEVEYLQTFGSDKDRGLTVLSLYA